MSTNQCCVWDITIKEETNCQELVLAVLGLYAKKYCFQKEKSETGYVHFQGRFSLIKKARLPSVVKMFDAEGLKDFRLSPTSKVNMDNMFYVLKDETRVDGPWRDIGSTEYIPQTWKRAPYPWQAAILATPPSDRYVNVLVDYAGGLGKSFVYKAGVAAGKRIYKMDPTSGFKEITRDLCSKLMAAKDRSPEIVIVNFNRAFPEKSMACALCGIETILDGEVQDDRYATKLWRFDAPAVWVFANRDIPLQLLSQDRWKKWKVMGNMLVSFDTPFPLFDESM